MLTPEEEKYLKTISKTKIVRIFSYDAKIKEIVKDITNKINQAMPELEVKFLGASALEISGQKDIDLYILCPANNFEKYLQKLTNIFGQPKSKNKESIAWNFQVSEYDIELYLTDPNTPQVQRQIKVYEILKNSPELLKEYKKLKESFSGKSYHDYQKAKYEFYDRILNKDERIPDYKEILKESEPFKVSTYKTTIDEKRVWQTKSEYTQETIPTDKNLLKKIGLKKSDKVLFVAGYYGDWANAIASAGCEVDYSELSKSILQFAKNKFRNNKNIKNFIQANFIEIPKVVMKYDWTISFEPIAITSGLPIAIIRSLINKKGFKNIIYPRYSLPKEKYTPLKLIAEVYGCKYSEKEIFIDAVDSKGIKIENKHFILTFLTNNKSREIAEKDIMALEKDKYEKDTLARLQKISTIIKKEFLK